MKPRNADVVVSRWRDGSGVWCASVVGPHGHRARVFYDRGIGSYYSHLRRPWRGTAPLSKTLDEAIGKAVNLVIEGDAW